MARQFRLRHKEQGGIYECLRITALTFRQLIKTSENYSKREKRNGFSVFTMPMHIAIRLQFSEKLTKTILCKLMEFDSQLLVR